MRIPREKFDRLRCIVSGAVLLTCSPWLCAVEPVKGISVPVLASIPPPPSEARMTPVFSAIDQAEAAFKQGDMAAAESILNTALQSQPDSTPLLVARADFALATGDPTSASLCLRRARAVEAKHEQEPSMALHLLQQRLALMLADRTAQPSASRWSHLPAVITLPIAPATTPATQPKPTPSPAAVPLSADVTLPPPKPSVSGPANDVPSPHTPTITSPASSASKEDFPGKLITRADPSDSAILHDSSAQWGASATASSSYSARYGPEQSTGAPNVFLAGNAPEAWAPEQQSAATAWLEVSFAQAKPAKAARIRQNSTPGAISRVEAIEPDGKVHLWWKGKDTYTPPRTAEIAWFIVEVPPTDYVVAKLRITFDLRAVPGWKQIDAVQIVNADR